MKFHLIFFFLITSNLAFGQLLLGPKLGLHAGQVQFEKKSFKQQFDPGAKVGGNAGAAITFPVMKPFSLHSELLFTWKGKSVTDPEVAFNNSAQYYYVELPIMMRMEFWPSKSMFLGIGPNLSYWLGGNGKIDDLETPTSFVSYDVHFGDSQNPDDLQITHPNRLQLGLLFGLGKHFELTDDRIMLLELRYELGHSFLGTADGAYLESLQFNDNLESKHRLISINVGYFWTMQKKSKRKKSSTYKAKRRSN